MGSRSKQYISEKSIAGIRHSIFKTGNRIMLGTSNTKDEHCYDKMREKGGVEMRSAGIGSSCRF